MVLVNRGAVFDRPNRGQHGLSKSPPQHSAWIDPQCACKTLDSPFYRRSLHEQFRPLHRIPQRRPNLIFDLADDAFRIDGQPAAVRIEEYVVMVEIAMKQLPVPL